MVNRKCHRKKLIHSFELKPAFLVQNFRQQNEKSSYNMYGVYSQTPYSAMVRNGVDVLGNSLIEPSMDTC